MGLMERAKRAWNVFMNRDPTRLTYADIGGGYANRPDRVRLHPGNEQTIISAIYTRIALDVSQTTIVHARMDEDGRYLETLDSGLNRCLTFEANIDQSGKAFIMDAVMSLCDEGSIAIVPVDTIGSILNSSYEIKTMRVGKIEQWYPKHVRIMLYNDQTGQKEPITLPKESVAIVENPLYAVMNEPNSTLRRLAYKLAMLDAVDEQSSSGKLDLIIQLPYTIKSELRKRQAEERRKDIETQLMGSKYGIAYTDGTEKITQLNRSVENNLMNQIEYLTKTLYAQLGLTEGVFNGTASEDELNNYYARTIEPIVAAIADAMNRRFLTKTAITQGQRIYYYRDPFKFVTASKMGELAERFTRNEILTTNEVRQAIGMQTSTDPNADELRNKNLYAPENQNGGYLDDEQTV
mgnify:FL=1|nr:MAG TPA: portal protein [Caudoviricetes sp.]